MHSAIRLWPLLALLAVVTQGCAVDVAILTPADGATFEQGTLVTLQGQGTYPTGELLLGLNLRWAVDGDGLGPGDSVQLDTTLLTSGPHTVTLTSSTGQENEDQDSITINITLPPLDVTIFSPANGATFDQSDTVTFTGEAVVSGRSTVVPSENLRWFIDDTYIGPGSPFQSGLSSFSPGTHTVRLEATLVDQNNETLRGSAEIQIIIRSGTNWNETYGRIFQDQVFLNAVRSIRTGEGDKQGAAAYVSAGGFFPGEGSADALALFYDKDGNLLDDLLYGGDEIDNFFSVLPLEDGLLFAGSTRSFGAGFIDAYLVRTDAAGVVDWEMNYGGSGAEDAYGVVATTDGGFVFTGASSSGEAQFVDLYLVKVDADGGVVWEELFGNTATDEGKSLVATSDGGFVAAGVSDSFGSDDNFYLVKADSEGGFVWEKSFGMAEATEEALAVIATSDGGFLLVGYRDPVGSVQADVYVVKTDADGNLVWEETYGGDRDDRAAAALEAEDGSYILAGATASIGNGSSDFYLLQLSSTGVLLDERSFGGAESDEAMALDFGTDNGYILAGITESFGASEISGYVVKTDQNLDSPVTPE